MGNKSSFMSQDTYERQLDGHQQLRQPDTSFSDEHDTVESTQNIRINEVCPLHENEMCLCIYASKYQYKCNSNTTRLHIYNNLYIFLTFTAATSGYETNTCC